MRLKFIGLKTTTLTVSISSKMTSKILCLCVCTYLYIYAIFLNYFLFLSLSFSVILNILFYFPSVSYCSVLLILLERNEYPSLKSGKLSHPKWLIIFYFLIWKTLELTHQKSIPCKYTQAPKSKRGKVSGEELGWIEETIMCLNSFFHPPCFKLLTD